MTGAAPRSDGDEPVGRADERMAELLSQASSGAELRRRLQEESSEEADDLLGRLNALDFVGTVVGEATDMPDRLGDYRITGLLGRGGMGTVYLAYQEQLEREVALKVLAATWSTDPTMRQRFRAEARATASLHHRHIVPIYDYGEAQGCLFFAMERVDGYSLDRHIAAARRVGKRPMEPLDAARRFAGVADALGLAHRRRILHRDVKPGNLLVGSDGTLALTDFGLAKALDQASARLTSKSGGFLGTLHYSPPEQALGGELTEASDLYSLGVTIFEAVTGELPIQGRTTEAVLQSILHGTPRRLKDVMPRPPRDLAAVVDKLLSREPQDRYHDGEALSRDLLRIADGDPVHIRRQPITLRLYRRARKNPVLSGAVLTACLLLMATLVLIGLVRREQGQNQLSRHQNDLMAVTAAVRDEAGWPWGPPHLLHCLTGGVAPPAPTANAAILDDLRAAAAEMPEDAVVGRMQRAYVEDPEPVASDWLAMGRGFEALARYDAAITEALQQRSFADHSVELRLYGLYLGRATAYLTAAVARPGNARRDLDLASYLRPKAVFPGALAVVLEVTESIDPVDELGAIERRYAAASSEQRAVVGRLLWALAGLRPSAAAHLMRFALTHRQRMAIQALARRWVDAAPADAVAGGGPTGFAAELQLRAVASRDALGDSARLRQLTRGMGELVGAAVHPESPLQGWYGAAQLLEYPRPRANVELLCAHGDPMTPRLQLAAWDRLLAVAPPRAVLELLVERFELLRQDHPGLPGIERTAALLHTAVGSATAAAMVDAWILAEPDDPEAQLARLTLTLRSADLGRCMDAAMAAVQNSADRAWALTRIADMYEAAADTAEPAPAAAMRGAAARFRSLLP